MSANRPHIDVLIVVPLPQELDALYSVLPSKKITPKETFRSANYILHLHI